MTPSQGSPILVTYPSGEQPKMDYTNMTPTQNKRYGEIVDELLSLSKADKVARCKREGIPGYSGLSSYDLAWHMANVLLDREIMDGLE